MLFYVTTHFLSSLVLKHKRKERLQQLNLRRASQTALICPRISLTSRMSGFAHQKLLQIFGKSHWYLVLPLGTLSSSCKPGFCSTKATDYPRHLVKRVPNGHGSWIFLTFKVCHSSAPSASLEICLDGQSTDVTSHGSCCLGASSDVDSWPPPTSCSSGRSERLLICSASQPREPAVNLGAGADMGNLPA